MRLGVVLGMIGGLHHMGMGSKGVDTGPAIWRGMG